MEISHLILKLVILVRLNLFLSLPFFLVTACLFH